MLGSSGINRQICSDMDITRCLKSSPQSTLFAGMVYSVLVFVGWHLSIVPNAADAQSDDQAGSQLTMIVMDPLSTPLSCPCVEGYAQRDYEKLADWLEKKLDRRVELHFNQSLTTALKGEANGRVDIVIGKSSVVRTDAEAGKWKLNAVAKLTDLQGSTTQHGLIVVAKDDPAKSLADIKGYRFFLGPPDSDEKHSSVLELLAKNSVKLSKNDSSETCAACSEGATRVLELHRQSVQSATAISSYAAPLLEGCGTVPPDSLRAIAKTEPVPFIEAFVSASLPERDQSKIANALLAVGDDPELCIALESLAGFLSMEESGVSDEAASKPEPTKDKAAKVAGVDKENPELTGWTGWRGVDRNGLVQRLPKTLPETPNILWRTPLVHRGLGGIAATEDLVVIGDRDTDDQHDVWRCLDSYTGAEIWNVKVLAKANFDYGNSPRATPLIHEDRVYLLGACGDLLCVDLASGEVNWQCNLRKRFGVTAELPWGYCGSPLLVDDRLIVAPGAAEASVVALDAETGTIIWKTPGKGPSYGSLIVATFGGKRQIVGHDASSIGGWDVNNGKRLWTVVPSVPGDFNVPTPLETNGKLLVTTENNGTRLYEFHDGGTINPDPIAINHKLKPNMSTPTIVGDRLYCVDRFLFCLDLRNELKEIWRMRDPGLSDYAAIIASDHRILVVGDGQLIVMPTDGSKNIATRQTFAEKTQPTYSHPAIVGTHLYLRGESAIFCFEL